MTSTHAERYRDLADRLFAKADDTVIDELFAPHYEGEYGGERIMGRERFRASVVALRAAIGPIAYEIHTLSQDGDLLWAHWTARGKHTGRVFDLAPTSRDVAITGLTLNRFENDKIVWGLVKWDRLALLEQLR